MGKVNVMLVESMKDWVKYDFGSVWKHVMRWICNHPEPDPGSLEVAGCRISVSDGMTRRRGEARYEYHRRMADVQLLVQGEEDLYVFPVCDLEPDGPFDEAHDIGFCCPAPVPTRIRLKPGRFVLLLPWDGHMPSMAVDNLPQVVRKIVAKIPLDKLEL